MPFHNAFSLQNTSVVIPLPLSIRLPRLIVTLSPSTDVHLAVKACSIIPLVRVHSGPSSPSGPQARSLRVHPSAISGSPGDERSLLRVVAAEVWPGGRPKPAAAVKASAAEVGAAAAGRAAVEEAVAAEEGGEVAGPEEEGVPAPGVGLFFPSRYNDL